MAFDYRDFDEEHRNLDTKVITISQSINEPIEVAAFLGQVGDSDDYGMDDLYDGLGFLQYEWDHHNLFVTTEANHTPDFHDDQVINITLMELPNESTNTIPNSRFDFQVTGTDGEEYNLFIYSEDETEEQIAADDVWFSHLQGAYMYSGNYQAMLQKEDRHTAVKQDINLGTNLFVLQDDTSTASMVYSEEGPDVLMITQKDGASFTRYRTFIVKDGNLKEIFFSYEGERIEPYFEGFRNLTADTWESLSFSNNSNVQWLGTTWKLDPQEEVFRNVENTEYEREPW